MEYINAHHQKVGHRIRPYPDKQGILSETYYKLTTGNYLDLRIVDFKTPSLSCTELLTEQFKPCLSGESLRSSCPVPCWIVRTYIRTYSFATKLAESSLDCSVLLRTSLTRSALSFARLLSSHLSLIKLGSLTSSLSLIYQRSSARCTRSAPYILARFARSESHVSIPSQVSCVAHGTTREHIHVNTLIDVVRSVIARVRLWLMYVVASGDLIS